ncbi:DUF2381 family protein [Corallococcus carmarthensis]|uniref:DUF2381 family protein n=1 Tax=Corallococcus carmarthensis TaxID=2316728 RepID=A0A3A8K943_9BACT|nr:DUF2381 family protein [Corallococcus carmarthensis]NOK16651.1 DUF2381 family protein [Corallococcus carmarthensis]RKH03719.1 DUF2381 family protein [Corallococcus carmarthensis]
MLQPFRLALPLALTIAWGAAAQSQPATRTRIERKRSVLLSSTSTGPMPVVHVAGDTPTVFLFSSPIQKKTLTFDECRIRVLDAGERSVIVQPVADLGDGERQEFGVFFADGRAPARAAFVLVTDPAEVNSRIDVQRPEPPNGTCPADAPAPVPKPEDFVLLGYLGSEGVTTSRVQDMLDTASGLGSEAGISFRGKGWILVDMTITNGAGRPPWTPQEATFTGRAGMPLRARLMVEPRGPIPSGRRGRVLAVVEVPVMDPKADLVFTVEVRGDGGRRLSTPDVRFPKSGAGASQ